MGVHTNRMSEASVLENLGHRNIFRQEGHTVIYNGRVYVQEGSVEYNGSWSGTLTLRDAETGERFVIKAMRSKFLKTREPYAPLHRFALEVVYQQEAAPIAPRILHYGRGNTFMNLPCIFDSDILFIWMEYKGQALREYLDTDASNVVAIRAQVVAKYRELAKKGFYMQDVSLDNVVIDAQGAVTVIDFDPMMVQRGEYPVRAHDEKVAFEFESYITQVKQYVNP
jgi:hypothetical protein